MEQPKSLFSHLLKELDVDGKKYKYFDVSGLNDPRVGKL
jgi:hypothetical protein